MLNIHWTIKLVRWYLSEAQRSGSLLPFFEVYCPICWKFEWAKYFQVHTVFENKLTGAPLLYYCHLFVKQVMAVRIALHYSKSCATSHASLDVNQQPWGIYFSQVNGGLTHMCFQGRRQHLLECLRGALLHDQKLSDSIWTYSWA